MVFFSLVHRVLEIDRHRSRVMAHYTIYGGIQKYSVGELVAVITR